MIIITSSPGFKETCYWVYDNSYSWSLWKK